MQSKKKPLTLSIIIPAYNEERHLRDCLESIAAQNVMPNEVIVVDNNSIDRTAEIASSYTFVTLVHESAQGLIPARNKGFNIAKGDLLARLDADSQLRSDWVQRVSRQFNDNPRLVGLTGPATLSASWWAKPFLTSFWSRMYFWYAYACSGVRVLWGPNMIIRRSDWQKIKSSVVLDDHIVHEDQDISFLLYDMVGSVSYDSRLLITTDPERLSHLDKALEYNDRRKRTLAIHQKRSQAMRHAAQRNWLKRRLLWLCLLPGGAMYTCIAVCFEIRRIFRRITS